MGLDAAGATKDNAKINASDRLIFLIVIGVALVVVGTMVVTLYHIATLPMPHIMWFLMRNDTSRGIDCVSFNQDTGAKYHSAPVAMPPGNWVFTNNARALYLLGGTGMGTAHMVVQRLDGEGADARLSNHMVEIDARLGTTTYITSLPEINVEGVSQMQYHISILPSKMIFDAVAGVKLFTGKTMWAVAQHVGAGDSTPHTIAFELDMNTALGAGCGNLWRVQHTLSNGGWWKLANKSLYCNETGSDRTGVPGKQFVNAESARLMRSFSYTELARVPAWKPADADGDFSLNDGPRDLIHPRYYAWFPGDAFGVPGGWFRDEPPGRLFCGPGSGPPLASDAEWAAAWGWRGPSDAAAAPQEPTTLRDARGEVLARVPRALHGDADRPHLGCIALENSTLVAQQPNLLLARGVAFDMGVEDPEHEKEFIDGKFVGIGRCCDPAVDSRCPAECAGQGHSLNFFHWRPPRAPRVVHVFPANLSALDFHTLMAGTVDPGRRRYAYLSGDADVIITLDVDTGKELVHVRFNASQYGKIMAAVTLQKPAQATAAALSPMAKNV
jgi:hypothetical protein